MCTYAKQADKLQRGENVFGLSLKFIFLYLLELRSKRDEKFIKLGEDQPPRRVNDVLENRDCQALGFQIMIFIVMIKLGYYFDYACIFMTSLTNIFDCKAILSVVNI